MLRHVTDPDASLLSVATAAGSIGCGGTDGIDATAISLAMDRVGARGDGEEAGMGDGLKSASMAVRVANGKLTTAQWRLLRRLTEIDGTTFIYGTDIVVAAALKLGGLVSVTSDVIAGATEKGRALVAAHGEK